MTIDEIRFQLKDGREAVLRSPREEDIPSTIDYLHKSAGETEFILRYPEECGKYTPEKERELFERLNASPDTAMILGLVDGRVIGNCEIHVHPSLKTRHRADVAITVLKDYWNQGVGTRMFEEMIRIAYENPHVTQMELGFIAGNVRARHLYEKMGFRISGVLPNAIRLRDGTMLNEYMMVKTLNREKE